MGNIAVAGTQKSKINVEVYKAMNIDVISLVKGPANMTPVKIIKNDEDQEMPGAAKQTADKSAVTIYSVIVKADKVTDEHQPMLDVFGINKGENLTVKKADGKNQFVYTVSKKDDDAQAVVIPLSAGLAVEVGVADVEVSKMLQDWSAEGAGGYFNYFAASAFMPSVSRAMDEAYYLMYSAMDSAEPGQKPTDVVNEIMAALTQYVNILLQMLPSEVIKMDKEKDGAQAKTETTTEEAKVEKTDVGAPAEGSTEAAPAAETKVEKTDTDETAKTGGEAKVEKTDTSEPESEPITLEGLAATVSSLVETVSGLTEVVKADHDKQKTEGEDAAAKLAALQESIDVMKADAEKTIPAPGNVETETPAETEVKKSDRSVWEGTLF